MDFQQRAQEIKRRADRISQLTCTYGLSRATTRLAYYSVYLPAIQYPLVSSYIPRQSLNTEKARATKRFLPAMGFHPNIPRSVVHAPKQLGGLGLQRLYTNQEVRNVTQMLKHLQADTAVGKLFRIDIDWYQRWAGIGKCVMRRPKAETPPTSSKYLMEIRRFLGECRASIEFKENPKVMQARNSFIMDHILQSSMIKRKIDCMNKVRLYLKVETFAEIANPEGTKIDQAWMQEGPKPSWSTLKWPEIKTPSKKMWSTWKASIEMIAQENGELRQKLGRGTKIPAHGRYKWMQDGSSAYHEREGEIRRHKITPRARGKAAICENNIPVIDRMEESTPTYPPTNGEIKIFGKAKVPKESKMQVTERIEIECEEIKYLMKNLEIEEEESFYQGITSGETLTVVSDGGLKKAGGFGWVLANDEEIKAKCSGSVKGSRDQMSSFRTEITGMASVMKLLEKIGRTLEKKLRVELHTDNLALVKRIKSLIQYNPTNAFLRNDHDAYWTIKKAREVIEIKDIRHIRGHQV